MEKTLFLDAKVVAHPDGYLIVTLLVRFEPHLDLAPLTELAGSRDGARKLRDQLTAALGE